MFESLTSRLNQVFDQLRRRGKLSEADVDAALREVRLALLEADVHFSVVKTFLARVRERAVGAEVSKALNPGQQVVKIVNEELINLLGEPAPLNLTMDHEVALLNDAGLAVTRIKRMAFNSVINSASNCDRPAVSTITTVNPPFWALSRARAARSGGLSVRSASTGTSARAPRCWSCATSA